MGAADASKEFSGLPAPKEVKALRIIGVVHPFYINHMYHSERDNERLVRYYAELGRDVGRYVEEEFRSADKILEMVCREAKDTSAVLVFVGDKITRKDFRGLREYKGDLFNAHPREVIGDIGVQRKLKKLGFKGEYDELWLLSRALDAFGQDRMLFYPQSICQKSLHKRLGERARDSVVSGCFMGSYSRDCVTINRNALCSALNTPLTDIPIRKSAGVDLTWPTSFERGELMRGGMSSVKERVIAYSEKYPGGHMSHYSLFDPASVKTYLLHEGYFRKTFRGYRISDLDATLAGKRQGAGDTGDSYFPAGIEAAKAIAEFMNGLDFSHVRRMPWNATPDEAMRFKIKLASYLAGRELDENSFNSFARGYQEKVAGIPKH
ncbi:MAG: hypothetical protein NTU61_01475 [Candidatus Altiarchaeota archaeon]|nr:hypothetical protein [Candidatus Altiarchaeota archaeon]